MVYYGLLLFFILDYARPAAFVPALNVLRLNSLVPTAVIVMALFTRSNVEPSAILREPNTKIILGFLGMVLASFLVADVTMMAFEIFTAVLGYVLIYYVLATHVTDQQRVKGVFRTIIIVHVFLAVMTPGMFTDPSTRHYIRGGTFLGDGNDYALSVNLCLPFCLFLIFSATRKVEKLVAFGLLIFLIICVVATQSRGGTLALGAVALYYWLKSSKKLVTGGLAVVGLAVVLLFAPPAYFTRMNTISDYENDGSAQGRLIAWGAGTRMALSNPVLGVGAGNFPANYTKFAPPGEVRWKTAHSIYFLALGELGVPGLGLLLAFILSNLWANRRLLVEMRVRGRLESSEAHLLASLSASVLAYAIAGAFLSATYYPHMFVLAALCVVGRRLARQAMDVEQLRPTVTVARPITYHWALQKTLPGRRAS